MAAWRRLFAAAGLAGALLSVPALAAVSWQEGVARAQGAGPPDHRAANPAQARLGAERSARGNAQRALLEQLRPLAVAEGKTVAAYLEDPDVLARVETAVRAFRVTGKRFFSDGGVWLDGELPLGEVVDALAGPESPEGEQPRSAGKKDPTGLVVDARHLKVKPALAPRLLDREGASRYALTTPHSRARRQRGVVGYALSLELARRTGRVGDRPLVLKAQKVDGSDLVLSPDDAKRLEDLSGPLAEGRVAVLVNAAALR